MDGPDRLPWVKRGLVELVDHQRAVDRVAVVVYAGASGLVLEPTPGNRRDEIFAALGRLSAGGSTAGAEGIQLPIRSPAGILIRTASIASCWRRTAISTSGSRAVRSSSI